MPTQNCRHIFPNYTYLSTRPMPALQNHEVNDKPRKLYTLIYVLDFEKGTVVLGYKKRGFGVGKCMYMVFHSLILYPMSIFHAYRDDALSVLSLTSRYKSRGLDWLLPLFHSYISNAGTPYTLILTQSFHTQTMATAEKSSPAKPSSKPLLVNSRYLAFPTLPPSSQSKLTSTPPT